MRLDVHLRAEDLARSLRDDARAGLTSTPKALPPKWFYDERGSRLFDDITRLAEYYPTRREREILDGHADEIAKQTSADTLVELGSGTSEKTRLLLSALQRAGTLRSFVPLDVSEEILCEAARAIEAAYAIEVHAVVGDFEHHLDRIPTAAQRRHLVAFLGGTIGNFAPDDRVLFLRKMASMLGPDDHVLIGFDLVKDITRLEAAYNDHDGVTAEFNRNVLHVLNRQLDADFDVAAFEHIARYDHDRRWIEMGLRSATDQVVNVRALDLRVDFAEAEEMRTEISAKFTLEGIDAELTAAGLRLDTTWTDSRADFALALAKSDVGLR